MEPGEYELERARNVPIVISHKSTMIRCGYASITQGIDTTADNDDDGNNSMDCEPDNEDNSATDTDTPKIRQLIRDLKQFGCPVHQLNVHVEMQRIVDAIESGSLKMMSDLSTKNNRSSSGFLFFIEEDEDLLQGGNFI